MHVAFVVCVGNVQSVASCIVAVFVFCVVCANGDSSQCWVGVTSRHCIDRGPGGWDQAESEARVLCVIHKH